jgi:two-component system, OmpR family, heavy metal sensor histidine kinase CusS
MQLPERARHFAARADVRTAWIISVALLLCVIVPGVLLYSYATEEWLEEIDRWFDFALHVAVREVEEHGPAALASDDISGRLPSAVVSVRVLAPDGALIYERGPWPDPDREVAARIRGAGQVRRSLTSAWWVVRRTNWMVGERTGASGTRVRLALPLTRFAEATQKVGVRMVLGATAAAGIVLAVALATTIRAFSPLRRATALLRGVGTGSLGLRLPNRETGDPIDAHAQTLNDVLARIDAGFARLRAFSSDAAHELRTPLNRISTVSEVALLAGGETELRAALEAVYGTTEALSRTVQALLLLAEIDDDRLALRPQSIELRAWIGQHVEAYAPSFEDAGVKLAAAGSDTRIEGDRVLLDRIVANLLDNALAHAPAGSAVEIRWSPRESGVAICVDDAGPGIPEPDRERVFARFARLGGEPGTGHGLGLALARAIAELHGGTLRVTRSPLGGARFELWLPDERPA